MVYKNYKLNLLLRISFLQISLLGLIWLVQYPQYLVTSIGLGGLIVFQFVSLLNYADRTNRMFVKFLDAIRYDDFSQTYHTRGLGKSFDELNREFNKVMSKFREIRAEKEAQYHYLRTLVQHIGTGLLVFDANEEVQLYNNAAKRLMGIPRLQSLDQLLEDFPELIVYTRENQADDRIMIKVQHLEGTANLAIRKTSLKLIQETFTILSIQDIQNELEDKEMEAWQNLIRVLTHEIINSVTPIASLSATISQDLGYLKEDAQALLAQVNHAEEESREGSEMEESLHDVHFAVQTIQKRSEGLIKFVRDFRKLTRIPKPQLEDLVLVDLVESVIFLQKEELKKHEIQLNLSIIPPDAHIRADRGLIEQVLINLIKNAVHAMEGSEQRQLNIKAYPAQAGQIWMEVSDNGKGIAPDAMKNIFVPFFTTKRTGSGIGLSLSRQVMRLHGGSIHVQSTLGTGATFTLKFLT